MRKDNSSFKTDFLSEAGTFMENRDYFAYVELDDMACWVAADGCDQDTELMSAEMAVQCVLESFTDHPTMSGRKLENYIQEAQEWLRFESRRVRLKASLILVVTDYTRIVWAVVGNARMYHFRGGRLLEQSRDLSLAQTLADRGEISPSAVDRHEERHNLLQYLGRPEGCEPFISKKALLMDGDVLLLTTAGLWESVDVPEMLDALEEAQEPTAFVDTLEDVLLSKQQADISNYTAAAVYADKIFVEDKKKRTKWLKRIALVMIPVLIAGGLMLYYKGRQAARMAEYVVNMQEYASNGDTYVEEQNYAQAVKAYSEARNEAKKLKDKLHVALYAKDHKKAELIVEGDNFLKDGNYEKALAQYKKAKEETKNDDKYKPEDLDARIAQIDEYIRIAKVVQEADLLAEGQDYKAAAQMYRAARKSALNIGFLNGEKEIKAKLDETEAKIASLEKEKKKLQAESWEKKGDRSFAAGQYEEALEAYAEAQSIYQEIDLLEPVLKLERSIAKAEDKLNPIPPAGAGNASTDASAEAADVSAPLSRASSSGAAAAGASDSESSKTDSAKSDTSVPRTDEAASDLTESSTAAAAEEKG